MIMINISCTCCQHYTQRKQYETWKKVHQESPDESESIDQEHFWLVDLIPLKHALKKCFKIKYHHHPHPHRHPHAVRALDPACNRRLQCQGPHINLDESRAHQIYDIYEAETNENMFQNKNYSNVGTTIINHPFGNGLYHLFMVITLW